MVRKFTVVTIENGVRTEQELDMSPEMERIADEAKAFNDANPDFWCHCGKPENGHMEFRGHSIDVWCKCGGMLQVG